MSRPLPRQRGLRLAQALDDTVDVRAEQSGPDEVAAGLLVPLVGDPGVAQQGTELALAGEHRRLVSQVERNPFHP